MLFNINHSEPWRLMWSRSVERHSPNGTFAFSSGSGLERRGGAYGPYRPESTSGARTIRSHASLSGTTELRFRCPFSFSHGARRG
jgi:hypothetical protein